MKINVALFITALSTTAASAAAGDDVTAVDRPHLRALLQNNDRLAACSAPKESGSFGDIFCDNCNQGQTRVTPIDGCMTKNGPSDLYSVCGDTFWQGVACCNSGGTKCYDPNSEIPVASMIIKADEEEDTTKKLGDEIEEAVVPSSSTLRASSLLKDSNVFTKQDGDETEEFLETVCPAPTPDGNSARCPRNFCANCPNNQQNCVTTNACGCDVGDTSCGLCIASGWIHKCCNNGGNNCNNGESGQANEEDAVMIKASEEEEVEVPQDTNKLDASSPLRASLLKVK